MKAALQKLASLLVPIALLSCKNTAVVGHLGQGDVPRHLSDQGRPTPMELAQRISSIAPWSSSRDYLPADWDRILQTANALNGASVGDVQRALDIFAESASNVRAPDYLEISKAFILLRVMFFFPAKENAGNLTRGGWIANGSKRSSGWPVVWTNGLPKLASQYLHYEGIPYSPARDYDELSKRYKKRDLTKTVKGSSAETSVNSAQQP